MDRIKKLCSFLSPCRVFADVGCDHGYCTQYMLRRNLCESAVISDISPKSLSKAEKLLEEYIKDGRCRAVCCDGLDKVRGADGALIAGLGGEEIISILKNSYIPQNFTLQPMKNAEKLRRYLLGEGCAISRDDIFESGGKFYFVICGANGGGNEEYTEAQLRFGKDSLKNPIFVKYIKKEIEKRESYLTRGLNSGERGRILSELNFLQEVINREIRRDT